MFSTVWKLNDLSMSKHSVCDRSGRVQTLKSQSDDVQWFHFSLLLFQSQYELIWGCSSILKFLRSSVSFLYSQFYFFIFLYNLFLNFFSWVSWNANRNGQSASFICSVPFLLLKVSLNYLTSCRLTLVLYFKFFFSSVLVNLVLSCTNSRHSCVCHSLALSLHGGHANTDLIHLKSLICFIHVSQFTVDKSQCTEFGGFILMIQCSLWIPKYISRVTLMNKLLHCCTFTPRCTFPLCHILFYWTALSLAREVG